MPAGGFKVIYQYANHLVRRGHQVSVVHPQRASWPLSPPQGFYRRFRREGGRLRDRLFKPRLHWVRIDSRVEMIFVPEVSERFIPDADAIFATAWDTAEPVLNLSLGKGQKFYLIQHYETWAGPKSMVEATWRFPLNKVVISKWLYEKGFDLGCDGRELTYITIGIDHVQFRLIEPVQARPKKVAMMFSLQEWKGSADGLQALKAAKAHLSGLKALLFGVCARPKTLPSWIDYCRSPSQEELVSRIYNGSSIFLCPSWIEGWPAPPAEAMACGCAVVLTDCGGSAEFAEDNINALVSPSRDPHALAHNLVCLLDDDGLRQQIANTGCDRIKQFTWEHSTDLLEKLIRKIVGGYPDFSKS